MTKHDMVIFGDAQVSFKIMKFGLCSSIERGKGVFIGVLAQAPVANPDGLRWFAVQGWCFTFSVRLLACILSKFNDIGKQKAQEVLALND
jgi:hypothetical protein